MTENDELIRAAIAERAGEWFIAHEAGALSGEERAAFFAWLKTSPAHVREYLGIARVAHHLTAAVGEPQLPLEEFLAQQALDDQRVVSLRSPQKVQRRPRVTRRVLQAWPIAAAVLALAVGLLWWKHDGELFEIPKTYSTAHGEQLVQRLPDGSMLQLDTESKATVRYSARERVVELQRGRALFAVAHEGTRRFRVMAGNAGAIAVGTRFDVYRKANVTEITVTEGKVAVFGPVPDEFTRVPAGYRVRISATGLEEPPAAVDVDEALAWSQHKIVFEHRPLGEVAAEFNRYGSIPVELEDPELRSLPVSGSFDASDTESFVAFLESLPGVRVEKGAEQIRVVKMTPAK